MTEPKRVSLQSCPTVELNSVNGNKSSLANSSSNNLNSSNDLNSSNNINNSYSNNNNNNNNSNNKKKSEKKKINKNKQVAPSIRFNLNLFESNDQKYPEFNYADLLKNAEKKRKRDKKKEDKGSNSTTNGTSGFLHFDDTDEDERVLDVARYFEEKYGNRKKNDDVDLGAGYDESDSFIDNTDMYDELVPQEVTTVHGGFYVNSGPLEFKDSDNVHELLKRYNHNNDDDDEDEDESSDDDSEEEEEISKNPGKRPLSSDNDEIDITIPTKSKPRILDS